MKRMGTDPEEADPRTVRFNDHRTVPSAEANGSPAC